MKKLILLFTIVCAGQLYGMVPEYVIKAGDMASLPQEIRKFIVLTLVESSTLEEAITAIRLLTETSKELNTMVNEPITMRTIIRILAQKFNAPSEYIAKKLNTSGSKNYMTRGLDLRVALYQKDFVGAENLIKSGGADIDYQTADVYPMLCASQGIVNLLFALNQALAVQETIAETKRILLFLQERQDPSDKENIEDYQQVLKSDEMQLDGYIRKIYTMAYENKYIFEYDDERLNYFIKQLDEENFKKAFAIIDPKTIMSSNLTYYYYPSGLTSIVCIIGANFSFVMYAIAANRPDLLEWLLKHNANLDLTMGNGDTALLMAIKLGKKEIVELLVKNKANVNQKNRLKISEEVLNENKFGGTGIIGNVSTLMTDIKEGTLRSIAKGGLFMAEDTPLKRLLYNDHFTEKEVYDLITLLLDNGANPNIKSAGGTTPLMVLTLMDGFANIMELLLDHGANPFIKENEGLTALDHMRDEGTEEDPERNEKIEMLKNAIQKQRKK